eukprot:Lithocolla_globosa_v1_NODE_933_length_3063_cov_11.302859.p1 type:complete len:235 gc:universal NODE_933_length_3063_cov_11.302859:1410-2114(+)
MEQDHGLEWKPLDFSSWDDTSSKEVDPEESEESEESGNSDVEIPSTKGKKEKKKTKVRPRDGHYRSLKAVLEVAIKLYGIKESEKLLVKLSGDGRNVGKKLSHVMITVCLFNGGKNILKPDHQFTIALYCGKEEYKSLEIALKEFLEEAKDLKLNGFTSTDGVKYGFKLLFSSDWKFMAIILGINAANSKSFCLWCFCTKKHIAQLRKNGRMNAACVILTRMICLIVDRSYCPF